MMVYPARDVERLTQAVLRNDDGLGFPWSILLTIGSTIAGAIKGKKKKQQAQAPAPAPAPTPTPALKPEASGGMLGNYLPLALAGGAAILLVMVLSRK